MINGNQKYIYGVARIKVLESRLFDKDRFERLVEAEGFKSSLKVLSESSDYQEDVGKIANSRDIEAFISRQIDRLIKLLGESGLDKPLIDILTLRYELVKIKDTLKKFFFKDDLTAGKDYISLEERLSKKYPKFKVILNMLNDKLNKNLDTAIIDTILDKFAFETVLDAFKEYKSPFLAGYISISIDLTNIATFLRIRLFDYSRELLEEHLFCGGSLDKDIFIGNFNARIDDLPDIFRNTRYAKLTEEMLERFNEMKSISEFDILKNNYLIEYLKKAKFYSFGIEPLAGYFFAKENELKNIRIILAAKLYDIGEAQIRQNLSATYV